MMRLFRSGAFRAGLVLGVMAGVWLGAVPLQAQDITNTWTRGGGDDLWDNPDNWDTGVPQSNHVVRLGAAFDKDNNPIADAAQAIDLNIEDAGIWSLLLEGQGNRSVTLTSSVSASLDLHETAPNNTGMALHMPATATADATLDVPLIYLAGNIYTQFRNDSTSAVVTIGPAAGRIQTDGNSFLSGVGTFRLHRHGSSSDTYRLGHANDDDRGTTIFDYTSGHIVRYYAGTAMHLASNFGLTRFGSLGTAGTSTVAIVESGTTNRTFRVTYGLEGGAGHLLQIGDSPDGSSGRVTLRLSAISGFTMTRGAPEVALREGDMVEFYSRSSAAVNDIVGWTPRDGISGAGSVLVDRTQSGFTTQLHLENNWTYTGRTMLKSGHLILAEHTSGGTTYYGSLPPATVVEIGENAAFNLNGIDATVGGLSDFAGVGQDETPTSGSVLLNGATLTINAHTNSSFGGVIDGAGMLLKTGSQTLTLSGSYTNQAGRTLRVEEGFLAVGGVLDVQDGDLEVAGGRITAGSLDGADGAFTITLTPGDGYQDGAPVIRLIDIAGQADIENTTLTLHVAEGYEPVLGTRFTLLGADSLVGAHQGGPLFQHTDGDSFTVDGVDFLLEWAAGSETIRLTVIPEPGSLVLLALSGFGLLRLRRRG